MGTLLINGKVVKGATHFAYDGCHKIYLIRTTTEFADMLGAGYGQDDIFPVSQLPQAWEDSCALKFISPADLKGPDFIGQCDEDGTVEYKEG